MSFIGFLTFFSNFFPSQVDYQGHTIYVHALWVLESTHQCCDADFQVPSNVLIALYMMSEAGSLIRDMFSSQEECVLFQLFMQFYRSSTGCGSSYVDLEELILCIAHAESSCLAGLSSLFTPHRSLILPTSLMPPTSPSHNH